MPASHRNEKVKCEDCGSMYTRINAARPQKTFEKQMDISVQTVIFIQIAERI